MIFYFSATGNSKYVAESIAGESEALIAVNEATDAHTYSFDVKDERVGFVTPTYNYTIPSIVYEFLQKLTLKWSDRPYIYYVGTYGTTTGAAASITESCLKKRGLWLDAKFDIKMPDTWTPIFDLSDSVKVKKIIDAAEDEIRELKDQVKDKVTGKHMSFTLPKMAGTIGQMIYNKSTRNTDKFKVSAACISCGMCARKCPDHAIIMYEDRPQWVTGRCIMCLGCLHRCPVHAISYGKNTDKHGQYTHPGKV